MKNLIRSVSASSTPISVAFATRTLNEFSTTDKPKNFDEKQKAASLDVSVNLGNKDNILTQSDVDLKQPSIDEKAKTALTTKDHFLIGATLATQTAANATNRQVLANFKLGSNTGEGYKDLFKRFGANPRTLLSGVTHRFILQGYTQALPNYYNKTHVDTSAKTSNESPLIANLRTGTWMALAGMPFELSGLKQPIEDKAQALGKVDLHYWKKSPTIAKSIVGPLLLRNNIYSAAVFGNGHRPLHERAGIATIAGILTNPIDNLVNIAAYEAAMAKDGTPVADIFRASW